MMGVELKIVCEVNVGGVDQIAVITTAPNMDPGTFVKNIRPKPGKPFFAFNSVPPGKVVGADFSTAPIVSADIAVNNAAIADMLANPPVDVLFFE